MFRFVILFAGIAACSSHAILPVVVPAVHHAPLVAAYPAHGFGDHGLHGHGWLGKSLGHHVYKRSPHVVPVDHGAHFAPALDHVAPAVHEAVSHHSRVDYHSAPTVVAAPIIPVVKSVAVAPVLHAHAAPLLHKSFVTEPLGYGAGHFGHFAAGYGHHGHH